MVPRSKQSPQTFLQTTIKKGASIMANATILADLTIGEYALIGAGGVVTQNVPPFTLWVGNPERHKGYVTREGAVINIELVDKTGNIFVLDGHEPKYKPKI